MASTSTPPAPSKRPSTSTSTKRPAGRDMDDVDDEPLVAAITADREPNEEKQRYVYALTDELEQLDPTLINTRIMLQNEIDRVKDGRYSARDHIILHQSRFMKLGCKVSVPQNEGYINYIGRIFGLGGENLRALSRRNRSRITVAGQGSMRNRKDVQGLDLSDPRHASLNEGLHLYCETIGTPSETFARVAHVINDARKTLDPTNPGLCDMKPEDLRDILADQNQAEASEQEQSSASKDDSNTATTTTTMTNEETPAEAPANSNTDGKPSGDANALSNRDEFQPPTSTSAPASAPTNTALPSPAVSSTDANRKHLKK